MGKPSNQRILSQSRRIGKMNGSVINNKNESTAPGSSRSKREITARASMANMSTSSNTKTNLLSIKIAISKFESFPKRRAATKYSLRRFHSLR